MRKKPLISIGLPVYNGERFVAQAIQSILDQTCDDFELIISDNASTDRTGEICRKFAAADRRVRYARSSENLGAAANYNSVFRLAQGRYFKWAAHDDMLEPAFLESCVKTLENASDDTVLCYTRSIIVNGTGQRVDHLRENPQLRLTENLDLRAPEPHMRLRQFLRNMSLCHPVFGLIRTDVLRQTRLILPYHSSDVILLTELALRGRFQELPQRLFVRRLHEGTSLWNRTPREVAKWFDPSRTPRVVLRNSRVLAEQTQALANASLEPIDRVRCAAVLARHGLIGRRHSIVQEWLNAGREVFRPTMATPTPAAA